MHKYGVLLQSVPRGRTKIEIKISVLNPGPASPAPRDYLSGHPQPTCMHYYTQFSYLRFICMQLSNSSLPEITRIHVVYKSNLTSKLLWLAGIRRYLVHVSICLFAMHKSPILKENIPPLASVCLSVCFDPWPCMGDNP